MLNKVKFFAFSSISLIILSACHANNLNNLQTLQDSSIVTQQSVETKSKFNTSKDSLWIAQNTARNWDISAELVRVEGSWVNEDGSSNSNWTYYFKSPFKPRILRVDYSGYGHEVQGGFFGSEIMEFDWNVDSDRAIEIAKQQGLRDFPVSQMTLEKKFADTEWELRSNNGIFIINAENGKLVSKSLTK